MQVGLITHALSRPTIEKLAEAISSYGVRSVQLDLASFGIESLPPELSEASCDRIAGAFATYGIEVAAVMGTFNVIHPNIGVREEHAQRCIRLIERCGALRSRVVALCTGTRDPHDMWRTHPDNTKPDAWRDLTGTLQQLLPAAERCGVFLGIEPEPNNVICSAPAARQLLDEIRSPHLGIVMDGANLFGFAEARPQRDVFVEAFGLLGPDIILAHAKDMTDDPNNKYPAAGTGSLAWDMYFRLLAAHRFGGTVVLHNLEESQISRSVEFIAQQVGDHAHIR